MGEKWDRETTRDCFEECWDELTKEYWSNRFALGYCSESDVHLDLAFRLINRGLPRSYVHLELPVSLDPDRFNDDILVYGRPTMPPKKYFRPDIAIMNGTDLYLFAEIRWSPIYIHPVISAAFLQKEEVIKHIQKVHKRYESEDLQKHIGELMRNIDRFADTLRKYNREGLDVVGYLCLIDECCPIIEEQIAKSIRKYDDPQFKCLPRFIDLLKFLK